MSFLAFALDNSTVAVFTDDCLEDYMKGVWQKNDLLYIIQCSYQALRYSIILFILMKTVKLLLLLTI